jgi:hypothetical protein
VGSFGPAVFPEEWHPILTVAVVLAVGLATTAVELLVLLILTERLPTVGMLCKAL